MIAALFVSRRGPYWDRPGVDAWDEKRDARKYDGSHPVVAHPPCGRWCQMAKLVEARYGYKAGEDGGCFESALANVLRCGGVLEHPAFTKAWERYGLVAPQGHFWQRTVMGYWVCQVSQCAYGCRARKLTWLLYSGDVPPAELDWSTPEHTGRVGGCENRGLGAPRIYSAEASRTPEPFAQELIDLATNSRRAVAA